MGLFDIMGELGLANLEEDVKKDLEKQAAVKAAETKKAKEKVEIIPDERDFLYYKKFDCPLCRRVIDQPTVKISKIRSLGHDWDLRPLFRHIDCNKYDVIYCRSCGYAALSKYYGSLPGPHADMLKKMIVPKHNPLPDFDLVIDYEGAILRYTMAWANAICRRAKASEKAYLCLKMAWLYRGLQEQSVSDQENMGDASKLIEWNEKEQQYLLEAKNLFTEARTSEKPPIAGMNDITLDFLLAALYRHFEEYNDAIRLLYNIISSKTATSVQRDKARDCLIDIKAAMKA